MKLVLICGGIGKKMWPQSRISSPKHFLPLFNGKSLFQQNYATLKTAFQPEDIYLQTNQEQATQALEQCPEIIKDNIFVEPEIRDQGPATGFMAAMLYPKHPDEIFQLIQADVIRFPTNKFIESIKTFEIIVKKENKLLTAIIRPDFPMMGCDYLRVKLPGFNLSGLSVYEVDKWLGRDSRDEVIRNFLMDKTVFLHANQYCGTPRILLEAYKKYAPDWYEPLMEISELSVLNRYDPKITLLYRTMAKAGAERVTQHELPANGLVAEVPFRWIDFGTWASVARYQKENNLYQPDNLVEINSENNYIIAPKDKQVAVIGLNNVTVIDTIDGLLVCSNDSTGKVGEVVEKLKERGKEEYL